MRNLKVKSGHNNTHFIKPKKEKHSISELFDENWNKEGILDNLQEVPLWENRLCATVV